MCRLLGGAGRCQSGSEEEKLERDAYEAGVDQTVVDLGWESRGCLLVAVAG